MRLSESEILSQTQANDSIPFEPLHSAANSEHGYELLASVPSSRLGGTCAKGSRLYLQTGSKVSTARPSTGPFAFDCDHHFEIG